MTRGAISATATYYDDDKPDTITYGNGTRTKYVFGDAGRLQVIRHETTSGMMIHQLAYQWTTDGLVESITETDDALNVSTTSFTYDNRNRLTQEVRAGQHAFDLTYEYDIAGNRLRKIDVINDAVVYYQYDVEAPETYGSQGNRLMSSVATIAGEIVEERWMTYDLMGRVDFVVRRIAGDEDASGSQWYRGTRLYYAKDGRLWKARSERWQLEAGGAAVACEPMAAMEYRYAGGRARYLVRPCDPVTMLPDSADDGRWHDYDGDWIYGDYSVLYDGERLGTHDAMAHVPGLAQFDHDDGAVHFLHGNLIGTTERMTDGAGLPAHRAVYTAFGEPVYLGGTGVPPVGTRYGYAGAWGDQAPGSSDPSGMEEDPLVDLGWLHVGERYYDPSTGRFLQRDPIGIRGGLNVYEYVRANPLGGVDPSGLDTIDLDPEGRARVLANRPMSLCVDGNVNDEEPWIEIEPDDIDFGPFIED